MLTRWRIRWPLALTFVLILALGAEIAFAGTYVSQAITFPGGASTCNVAVPTGLVTGDYVQLITETVSAVATQPGGFTQRADSVVDGAHITIWDKQFAGETGTYNFSISGSNLFFCEANGWHPSGVMITFDHANISSCVSGTSCATGQTTTANNNETVINYWAPECTIANNLNADATVTNMIANNPSTCLVNGYFTQATAGTPPAKTGTEGTSTPWRTAQVSIQEAATATPTATATATATPTATPTPHANSCSGFSSSLGFNTCGSPMNQ